MKIKDVVELTNISADTLRYYEKIGLLNIKRKNGVRFFSKEDIEQIQMIIKLKTAGFMLDEIEFLFTLDNAIENPMKLSLKDVQTLKDVNHIIENKIKISKSKINQIQESIVILEKMNNKLIDALKTGEMKGYNK